MIPNDLSALFQQFSSASGLQQRFRRNSAVNAGLGVVNRNTQPAGTVLGSLNFSPEMTAEMANNTAQSVNALPYQTGSGPGQTWPGDPNWAGMIQSDPVIQAAIINYLKRQMGPPAFQLPSAPPLQ